MVGDEILTEHAQILWIGEVASILPATWNVDTEDHGAEAMERALRIPYDAVVLSGAQDEVVDALQQLNTLVAPLLVWDPLARASDAARYVRLGAEDVAGPDDDPAA